MISLKISYKLGFITIYKPTKGHYILSCLIWSRIICHIVKVSDDLQCHTTIYFKTIPMYSIRSVLSVTELISLLKCVEEAVVCFGNSDSSFITICSDRNGELCNRSGWLMLL